MLSLWQKQRSLQNLLDHPSWASVQCLLARSPTASSSLFPTCMLVEWATEGQPLCEIWLAGALPEACTGGLQEPRSP